MLHFVGDVHAHWAGLKELDRLIQLRDDRAEHTIIQVGDFGWDSHALKNWQELQTPVYAIDGNHEDYNLIPMWSKTELTEVRPNLFYVPRGFILEQDGLKIGCVGGAASVDGYWRRKNVTWWPELEVVRAEQCGPLWETPVDVLVVHTPPQSVISAHWPPINVEYWNLPRGWHDPSAKVVDELWNIQGVLNGGQRPPLFCGHMHKAIRSIDLQRPYQVLDIAEIGWLPAQRAALR